MPTAENSFANPTVTLLLIVLSALIASFALFHWLKAQRHLRALRIAQSGREADELDLDRRLGLRQDVELEVPIEGQSQNLTLRLAVRQIGSGPDLLFLHGIGASMLIYRRLAPLLADRYRVTSLDFPGFGASDKPRELSYKLDEQADLLKRAVQRLGLKRPLVVASSMGGAISLHAATQDPDLFRGLLALSPATDPRRIPMAFLPLTRFGERLHGLSGTRTVRAAMHQVLARKELITPALTEKYREPFASDPLASAAFLKAVHLLADRRMPKLFSELRTPLRIVRGTRDSLVRRGACDSLVRIVPHATLVTHPTASHHIMEDEPEFVAQEIVDFDRALTFS